MAEQPKTEKPFNIDTFIAEYEPKIKACLIEVVSHNDNKDTLLKYIQGGKNLRGKLALLTYFACGGTNEQTGLKIAAASELSQSASLIKDDIIDKDVTRRGADSAWVENGPLEAVRTADTMIITGLDTLVEFGATLVKTFVGGWKEAWTGESKEFNALQGLEKIEGPAYKFYIQTIRQKTAALFVMSAKLGAEGAGASSELINIMANYGMNLGIAYQLGDDYVDFSISKIKALPKIGVVTAAQVEQSLKTGVIEAVTKGKFNIGQIFSEMDINAVEFYKEQIKEYVNIAMSYAVHLLVPSTKYLPLLRDFPNYCVKQMLAEGKVEL